MDKNSLKKEIVRLAKALYHLRPQDCTAEQLYEVMLTLSQELNNERKAPDTGRKVYYFSSEFLIGKLLSNNLLALDIFDTAADVLREMGHSLEEIEAVEPEPSLGNGGLGRLAACFLDSIAALGLPGDGVGLNYHYGLFRQKFENCKQQETPNPWIENRSWLIPTDTAFDVPFGCGSLKAKMFDIAIPGAHQDIANRLHLFDVEEPALAPQQGIDFDKADIAHHLTSFLYPDDSDDAGRILRVYQQYFMVSAGAQLILKEMEEKGYPAGELSSHVVIQINDTHPSMVIPEMIRLLTEKGLTMDQAVEQVSKCCAYTNHTILAEALEKWPISFIEKVAPQLVPIIRELDKRAKEKYESPTVAIIDQWDTVHMAHMDIHYSFSVNGVAQLHTDILKNSELKAFSEIYPEKFNNKTNGVTFRRWLEVCNPELSRVIDISIGTQWRQDAAQLEKLMEFQDKDSLLIMLQKTKRSCKERLCRRIEAEQGIHLNPESIFDIQIKRIHEYKRQQMNALYVIYQYQQIKAGHHPEHPITVIFGGKAAPAYVMAKNIIHLILCLQKLINSDPDVSRWLQVVMVENYNVSWAASLIPACDISEQISLASKEASGTGNMKFMANGAVTLGTMDGANVEIAQLVGDDNIYTFGQSSEHVIDLYARSAYHAQDFYHREAIKPLVDFIVSPELLNIGDEELLKALYCDIQNKDWFMALLDIESYIETKNQVIHDYGDRKQWAEKMLCNIAKSGFFSSDRTIAQYNDDIWHLK